MPCLVASRWQWDDADSGEDGLGQHKGKGCFLLCVVSAKQGNASSEGPGALGRWHLVVSDQRMDGRCTLVGRAHVTLDGFLSALPSSPQR